MAHKPRQIACVGFVRRGRVHLRIFCLRDTGRIYAFQVLLLFKSSFFPIIATHPPVAIIVTDGYVCIKVLFFGIVKRERILNNIGCLNLRSAKVPEHIFYLAEVCPDNIDQIANQVI